MGVYYKAKIVVGLPLKELREIGTNEIELSELLEEEKLLEFNRYYDAGGDENNIIGLQVVSTNDYSNAEISLIELDKQAAAELHKFNEITGVNGRVYLTTVGY